MGYSYNRYLVWTVLLKGASKIFREVRFSWGINEVNKFKFSEALTRQGEREVLVGIKKFKFAEKPGEGQGWVLSLEHGWKVTSPNHHQIRLKNEGVGPHFTTPGFCSAPSWPSMANLLPLYYKLSVRTKVHQIISLQRKKICLLSMLKFN